MIRKLFEIGSFSLLLEYPEEVPIPANFQLFEKKLPVQEEAEQELFQYRIEVTDELPEPLGTVVLQREDFALYRNMENEERMIGVKGLNTPYALYRELSEQRAEIYLKRSFISLISADPAFVSLFALEKQMLRKEELILHCAFMEYQGEAILFSAPSGTGKTTQATLWERHRNAHVVNGDRALLSHRSGSWEAMGWPVCSSSNVCENKKVGIRAIVMLSQAKENHARPLRPQEAFIQLYTQLTVNSWDRGSVSLAGDLLEQLISEVPVFHFACNMEAQAVDVLEAALDDVRYSKNG